METRLGQQLLGRGAGAGDGRQKARAWGAQGPPRRLEGEPEIGRWAEAGTFGPCTSRGSPRNEREGTQLCAGGEAQGPRRDGAALVSRRGTGSGAPGHGRPVASRGRAGQGPAETWGRKAPRPLCVSRYTCQHALRDSDQHTRLQNSRQTRQPRYRLASGSGSRRPAVPGTQFLPGPGTGPPCPSQTSIV